MKITTLCYLIDNQKNKILLGKKKYGGAKGKLNGFGGKLDANDATIKDAAIREFLEETQVTLIYPELISILIWHTKDEGDIACYVYHCFQWEGTPEETDEMTVGWYDKQTLSYDDMWASDRLWFPLVMQQKNLLIHLYFNSLYDAPYKMTVLCNQTLTENLQHLATD